MITGRNCSPFIDRILLCSSGWSGAGLELTAIWLSASRMLGLKACTIIPGSGSNHHCGCGLSTRHGDIDILGSEKGQAWRNPVITWWVTGRSSLMSAFFYGLQPEATGRRTHCYLEASCPPLSPSSLQWVTTIWKIGNLFGRQKHLPLNLKWVTSIANGTSQIRKQLAIV